LKWLRWLLVYVPLAFLFEFVWYDPLLLFLWACGALLPLALPPGNAAESIMTVAALSQGKRELLKASIRGSSLGNLLLILGPGLLPEKPRHGRQRFNLF
jgi:Ca2+:H+ antiporter